jgi:hypothetical protein
MLGQDLSLMNYSHLVHSNNLRSYYYNDYDALEKQNKIKKEEKWFFYFKKLIDDSLSKRFLSSCDSENDNNILCPISLDKMENPAKTSCGHVFEKENIIMWIREKRTCPICRKKLDLD